MHTSEKSGLYVNMEKTKMMFNTSMDSFAIGKQQIKVVQKFILLGSVIGSGGDCRIEMRIRLALGRAAVRGLDRICKDRELTIATMSRLVRALVFPVATYGCESWTMR